MLRLRMKRVGQQAHRTMCTQSTPEGLYKWSWSQFGVGTTLVAVAGTIFPSSPTASQTSPDLTAEASQLRVIGSSAAKQATAFGYVFFGAGISTAAKQADAAARAGNLLPTAARGKGMIGLVAVTTFAGSFMAPVVLATRQELAGRGLL